MKKLISYLLIATMLFTLAGCAQKPQETAPTPDTPAAETDTPPAVEAPAPGEYKNVSDQLSAIGIGTASVGGALYALGGGFVNVWNKLGVTASAEVTGGSVHNCNLIAAGDLGSALISQGAAFQSWEGTGLFAGEEPNKKLRTALPLHSSYIHGWTLDESINSYKDLGGKIVCGGPAGGTSDEYNKEILGILGVEVGKFVNTSFSDSTNMLRDSTVHVFVSSMGAPAAAVAEAASTLNAKIIGVSDDEADIVMKEVPFYVKLALPANTYSGQTEPVPTIADVNAYFFSVDVPEEVVYEFVKASYESLEELSQAFGGIREMTLENVMNLKLPLHKGAYKYYQELGVEIPEAAMPID
jgi:TRAP transporter TAXI family solute receptor